MSENRFVLIKPGEVLLVGNAPNLNADQVNRMSDALYKALGVRVCVFADDISLDRFDPLQLLAFAAPDGCPNCAPGYDCSRGIYALSTPPDTEKTTNG